MISAQISNRLKGRICRSGSVSEEAKDKVIGMGTVFY